MKREEAVLLKDQISSYFERIQSKKDDQKIGFSVGSSITADVRGSHRTASSANTTGKTALFSSQLITSGDAAPPMTLEEEKASTAARCLAILGVASSAAPVPTKEEIIKSRKQREQEIMKKSEEIKRIEEENRNRRPLVWDKPTFCPFGGETKSDETEEKSKKRKATENCSTLRRQSSSSSVSSTDPCSNLLSKTSKRNRHDNLFPYNMFGMSGMSGQSSSANVGMDWSKEKVDSFVEFTDQMILAAGKKKREQEGTISSTSSVTEEEKGEFRRRSSIGYPCLI